MTKELSPLARQIMGHANIMPMYTQKEFDSALAEAKAEIMAIAIQTTKQAILIEREECAKLADECVDIEKLGDQIRKRLSQKPE